jgi:hypothetical protein
MVNVNCLEGIRCPGCGNEDAFYIESTAVMYVTDDGIESRGDTSWNDDGHTECAQCERSGKLAEFKAKPAPTGEDRCEICDWPLAKSADEGCVTGNCSYQPEPFTDEYRRIEGRRQTVAARKAGAA